MYNISSCISKDIKIFCIVSDYSIAQTPDSYQGVGYISLYCKEHNTRHLHMM